ncbi:putative uncharacterized protein [Burkholderiales bacterium GJ-E10]|nr:putative uncharacterized protein [Burkholderiales bacterium GJ-E10]
MASYTNAEQIFIDVLTRVPGEDEWVEIRSVLQVMGRAGFAVEDPSNAAHVALFAWGWARSTGRADALAAIRAAVAESAVRAPAVDLAPVRADLEVLRKTLEKPENQKEPVSVKVDLSVLRGALRDSFSMAWLIAAGALLALAFWGGTSWEEYRLAPAFAAQQQTIDRLTVSQHHDSRQR